MKMEALDDPTLALIARFVVADVDELKLSDEQYLQHQLTEIKRQKGVSTWVQSPQHPVVSLSRRRCSGKVRVGSPRLADPPGHRNRSRKAMHDASSANHVRNSFHVPG
jgi:hypothetical protein